ncbi:hypothetical protein BVI434_150023 [Burkholderia vietnamiensis]|nr:hypothetical protein BVI434_150023 [Burkholderia vietnamiensis]
MVGYPLRRRRVATVEWRTSAPSKASKAYVASIVRFVLSLRVAVKHRQFRHGRYTA